MPPFGPTAAQVAEAHAIFARLGSKTKAANALNMSRSTLTTWLNGVVKPIEGRVDLSSDSTIARLQAEIDTLKESLQNATRPRYTIRQGIASRGERLKIVVIGDAHDSPHLDKERFVHIGKHINSIRPDVVIQIGDFMTADSVSTHEGNHTIAGRGKPTYNEDIASFRLALDALGSALNYNPEMHVTMGNHERRVMAFENENPEVDGMMSEKLNLALSDRGWTYSPYGEPTFYGGVAFLHAALNRLGKTFGGKTAENQIANETVTDCVIGHSHIKRVSKHSKLHHRHVTIANVGCALPDGHVESYAQHAMTGWSYGIMTLGIKDGHIVDDEWVSMATLKERHG